MNKKDIPLTLINALSSCDYNVSDTPLLIICWFEALIELCLQLGTGGIKAIS